ncbi:uncharacterized protein LOC143259186 [Megalopta genalis]|uniref:uncharacterized protein LOC143259186 n=1 Tax=Megalopta genalis TaxID=115081 RepID=UPI003FD41238
MDSKKDNKMAYLLGGTAVGVVAGFLVEKVLKKTFRVQAETSRTATINNKKINVDWKKLSVFNTPLEKIDNFAINNINDITLERKHNQTKHNIKKFHNISIEDNTEIEPTIDRKKLLECSNHCTSTELSDTLNNSFNDNLQDPVTDENVLKNNTYNINSQSSDEKVDKRLDIAQCSNTLNNIDVIFPEKQNYFNDM